MFNLIPQQGVCDRLKSAVLKTRDPIERNRQLEAIRQLECAVWQPTLLAQVMDEFGTFILDYRSCVTGDATAVPKIVARYLALVNVAPGGA